MMQQIIEHPTPESFEKRIEEYMKDMTCEIGGAGVVTFSKPLPFDAGLAVDSEGVVAVYIGSQSYIIPRKGR